MGYIYLYFWRGFNQRFYGGKWLVVVVKVYCVLDFRQIS